MPKNNAAGRLYVIFSRAPSIHANTATAEAWAQVLRTPATPGAGAALRQEREIARLLGLLHDELESARRELAGRGTAPAAYEPHFTKIENALTLRALPSTWNAVTQHLSPEVVSVLHLLSEMLPESEETLTPEQLAEAGKAVDAMRAAVAGAEVPGAVRRFLEQQVALAERALREYPIRGAAAFRSASQEAAIEWADAYEVVRDYAATPAVEEVRTFWERVEAWKTRAVLVSGLAVALFGGVKKALATGHAAGVLPPGSAVERVERLLNHDALHGGNGTAPPQDGAQVLTPGTTDPGPAVVPDAAVPPGTPASTRS